MNTVTKNEEETFVINDLIKTKEVRLINDEGTMIGVINTREALSLAENKGLDLVMISAKADPPICKIIDFGKYKYQHDKKLKEKAKIARANEIVTKEIKFRPTTDDNDVEIKIKKIREFLAGGDKVRLTIVYKTGELRHVEKGHELMNYITSSLSEIAKFESTPTLNGKTLSAVVVKNR